MLLFGQWIKHKGGLLGTAVEIILQLSKNGPIVTSFGQTTSSTFDQQTADVRKMSNIKYSL